MLSKNDKLWIKDVIKDTVIEALTVEWKIEKMRHEKTGQPLAVPEIIVEEVFLPSALLQILPYHEGALRGMQKDVSKTNNKINNMEEKIDAVGNLIIQTENSLKCLASLSDNIKQINLKNDNPIEVIDSKE